MARVVQLTDTHIVREGSTYFGSDTARHLANAIAAVKALDPLPDYIVVSGDLVNSGGTDQYVRFHTLMETAGLPYFVVPGNHDERENLRATLPEATFGASHEAKIRYAVDDFPIRFVGLDLNSERPWPGAKTDPETLDWLAHTLATAPGKATIVAVHQPPFRSGLHYLDVGGFLGAAKLRRIVDANPQVCALICGHIHCSRSARWKTALASSAPSTAPQIIPLLFMRGKIVGVEHERPGFVIHDVEAGAYRRTEFRVAPDGTYAVAATANGVRART